MKWFLDTEFYEHGGDGYGQLGLISIGLVNLKGDYIYAENDAFDWAIVPDDHWLQENVRPHMTGTDARSPREIRGAILNAVGKKPEFWGWYCDYDWVALCWLFGRMIDLPDGFPMFCHDLRQLVEDRHIDPASLPKQEGTEHKAIDDARWNRLAYQHITKAVQDGA